MKNAASSSTRPKKRKSSGIIQPPAGDVTFISVPRPPASAFNKDRPIGCLLQAQLQHVRHAESARLPRHKRAGRSLEDVHTEAEAASYIAAVTAILHPQRRRKSRSRPATQ